MVTSATASENCRQVCLEVWRDRATVVTGRGDLSAETALVRAVYWRLCKIGEEPGQGLAEAPPLKDLVRQYRDEAGLSLD